MRNWTSDEALAELDTRVGEIEPLKQEHRKSANHVRWALGVLEFLEQVFGQNSRLYLSSATSTGALGGSRQGPVQRAIGETPRAGKTQNRSVGRPFITAAKRGDGREDDDTSGDHNAP